MHDIHTAVTNQEVESYLLYKLAILPTN